MRIWTRCGAALAASTALAVVCGGAQAQNAAGEWHGTAIGPFGTGTVGVTLKAKAGGGYEGSYVTPRLTDPLDEAKVDKGTLTFSTVHGSYTGRWDAARKAWVGKWTPKVVSGSAGPAPSGAPPFPMPSLSLDLVLTAGKP